MPSRLKKHLRYPFRCWWIWLGLASLLFLAGGSAALAQPAAVTLEELRVLAHTLLPAQVLVNQGGELVYGPPPRRPAFSDEEDGRLKAFGGAVGGRQKIEGSARTRVDGFSLLAGLGQSFAVEDSPLARLGYGFFAEASSGDFEIGRTSLAAGRLEGAGQVRQAGGGFSLKTEFHNGAHSEIAFRAGHVWTSFDSLNLPVLSGIKTDHSAWYSSAIGELGYVWAPGEELALDFYARMLWSAQGGREDLDLGPDRVSFESLNSSRVSLGARVDYKAAPGATVFADAAWEHEFNGRAELRINGSPVSGVSDLRGDSFLGGIGLELQGGEDWAGFSARFALGGAWGEREALTGSLRLGYYF